MVMKALLHGGPLSNSWWEIGQTPPRLLVPQDGLSALGETREMVLLGDFPVPVGGSRYELLDRTDGRVVYGWAEDARAEFEHIACFRTGPAVHTRMPMLGLTSPWPFMRLAPLERMIGVEWTHIPWHEPEHRDGEVLYELHAVIAVPPAAQGKDCLPEAMYHKRLDLPKPAERTAR